MYLLFSFRYYNQGSSMKQTIELVDVFKTMF